MLLRPLLCPCIFLFSLIFIHVKHVVTAICKINKWHNQQVAFVKYMTELYLICQHVENEKQSTSFHART